MREPNSKIMTVEDAVAWRRQPVTGRAPVVMTNGCFDLLHRGHVEYLTRARLLGGSLLVAVNTDESVRALKGPDRPVIGEADRCYLLASLEAVDEVVLFGRQADELIRATDLATLAGTIPYEILCGIGRRVTRVYTRVGRRVEMRTLLGSEQARAPGED